MHVKPGAYLLHCLVDVPDAQQTRTVRLKDRAFVGIDFVLLARRQKLLEGFVDAHDLEGDTVLSIAAVWNGGERRACHPAKLELFVVRLGRAQRDERDFLAPYVERGKFLFPCLEGRGVCVFPSVGAHHDGVDRMPVRRKKVPELGLERHGKLVLDL